MSVEEADAEKSSETPPQFWSYVKQIQIGIVWWENPSLALIQAAVAEFFCSTFLLFFGIGTIVFGGPGRDVQGAFKPLWFEDKSRTVSVASAFGLASFVLCYAAISISGGLMNPALTTAFLLTRKLSLPRALLYLIAQCGGAILGAYVVFLIDASGWAAVKGGANNLLPGQSLVSIFALEFIITAALAFVVVTRDTRPCPSGLQLQILSPLATGVAVFVAHITAIPLDGCALNPARSLGPAIFTGSWHNYWIWWAGPLSGAIFAALTYEIVFRPSVSVVREGGGGGVTPEGFEASQAFIGVGGDQRSGLGAGLKRPHGFYDSAADDRDVDSHYLEAPDMNGVRRRRLEAGPRIQAATYRFPSDEDSPPTQDSHLPSPLRRAGQRTPPSTNSSTVGEDSDFVCESLPVIRGSSPGVFVSRRA